MITVVSGLLIENNRVLMVQRRPDKPEFPWGWESPGGKVEQGEELVEALEREILEELGIWIPSQRARAIWARDFLREPGCKADFHLVFFEIRDWVGRPAPLEGQPGYGWFTADELEGLTLLPANRAALKTIQAAVRREVAGAA